MHVIWTIIIGFIAGVIAKFVTPGKNEPSGLYPNNYSGNFAGAFVASYLGQAVGWYRADEDAGLIGAVVGAIIILVIWDSSLAVAARNPPGSIHGHRDLILAGARRKARMPRYNRQQLRSADCPHGHRLAA